MIPSETDKKAFVSVLGGENPVKDREAAIIKKFSLIPGKFVQFVVQFRKQRDDIATETLENLFASSAADFVVDIDEYKTILIKSYRYIPDSDKIREIAELVVGSMETEVMASVCVGYSDPNVSCDDFATSYQKACQAIQIGSEFFSDENVFCFEKLGFGRIVSALSADMCGMFIREMLGDNKDVSFDEETLGTITKFLKNDLNITSTSKELYIHRNTLIYRLEKIKKSTGLDIRGFEDAMRLKMALMAKTHLEFLIKNEPGEDS